MCEICFLRADEIFLSLSLPFPSFFRLFLSHFYRKLLCRSDDEEDDMDY